MTHSHWLVTQSVTSYIYHPDTGPGESVVLVLLWDSSSSRFGSTPPSTSSTAHCRQQPLLRENPPVERAPPLYIPCCVLPGSQPNPARRSGAPGDTRYPSAAYKEPVMDL